MSQKDTHQQVGGWMPFELLHVIDGFVHKYDRKSRWDAVMYLITLGLRCILAYSRGLQIDLNGDASEEEHRLYQELYDLGVEHGKSTTSGGAQTRPEKKPKKKRSSLKEKINKVKKARKPKPQSQPEPQPESKKRKPRGLKGLAPREPEPQPPPAPVLPGSPVDQAAKDAEARAQEARQEVKNYLKGLGPYVAHAFETLTDDMTDLQKVEVARDWGAYDQEHVVNAVIYWTQDGCPTVNGPAEVTNRAQKISEGEK